MGEALQVREITWGEHELMVELYLGLSERSRALRFGTPLPRWPAGWIERVTAVDGITHTALGAFVVGRLIGVLHRVLLEDGAVEVAMAVADEHQGMGVGSALLDEALRREGGRRSMVFTLNGENRAMARMLARRGATIRYRSGSGEAVLGAAA